jgi:outer membrane protein OmpA-like peptidoglycan-associated protein
LSYHAKITQHMQPSLAWPIRAQGEEKMGNPGRLNCLAIRASRQENGQYEPHGPCGRKPAKDGPLCAQHRDKLAAHPDWPLQQGAHRKSILAALAPSKMIPPSVSAPRAITPPPAGDSALAELLKRSAIPAAIAVLFGGFALLLEQIYLSAFDIDLNVLGSQTDAASVIVRNSGYLVAAMTGLLVFLALATTFTLLAFVTGVLIAKRAAPEVNRVRSRVYYLALRAWRTLRRAAIQFAGSPAGKKLGMRPATIRPFDFDPEANCQALDRASNKRWTRIQAAVHWFAGQTWNVLFTGNRNRNWVRTLLVSTPLAGLLVVLLVFLNSRDIMTCVAKYDANGATGEFCADRSLWAVPKPFLRRPQIATVLLKSDFAGETALNVAYCQAKDAASAGPQNNCEYGRLLNGSYSEPMLHIGNYGVLSLFLDMRPGGRAVSIRQDDIKAMSFGHLSPEQKPVSFAHSVSSMLVWLRSNFPAPERPAIYVVDGGQKGVADGLAELNGTVVSVKKTMAEGLSGISAKMDGVTGSVNGVAARIGGAVSVANLRTNLGMSEGLQVAALEMSNADAGAGRPAVGSAEAESPTVIAALDRAVAKLAGMTDIASALGHEKAGAPSGLMQRLDGLNKSVKGLPPLVIPAPLVTVNLPAMKVENIVEPAAVTVENKVETPSVKVENIVVPASVSVKNIVQPAPIKEVTVRLAGPLPAFASAGLPDEWIGAPKAIREFCEETSISWIGAPIEFDRASTSPREANWLDTLLAGIKVKMAGPGNNSGLIVIRGSADSIGSPMTNLEFAERRAGFVHSALELAIGRDQELQQSVNLGSAWNIASYGVGEQFASTSGGAEGAANSPRYVRVGLCNQQSISAAK